MKINNPPQSPPISETGVYLYHQKLSKSACVANSTYASRHASFRLSTYISFTIPIVSSSRSQIVYRFMGNIFAPAFILTHQIFDTVPRHLFAVGIEHGYKPIIIRRRWHGIPLLYPDLIVAGSHLLAYTRTFSTMPNRKVFEKKVKNFQFSSSTIFDNAT